MASGCASMNGGRVGFADRSRSTASIGGENVRVSSNGGAPSVAELGEPEIEGRAEGRISGRVLDPEGRPVARAEVRLTDGSARAGRDHRALTDDAGGFTLRGLRPGAAYTILAQGDDDRSSLVGRATARAPSGNVRIRLREGDDGTEPDQETAEASPNAARRVGRVSERDEIDEFLGDEDEKKSELPAKPRRRVNDDDLPRADDVERTSDDLSENEAPAPRRKTSGVAWRPADGASQLASADNSTLDRRRMQADPDGEKSPPVALEDEGPNPLPPAREQPVEVPAPSPPVDDAPSSNLDPPTIAPAVVDPAPPAAEPDTTIDSASIPAEVAPRRRATWGELAAKADEPGPAATLPISTRRLPASDASAESGGRIGFLGLSKPKPKPAGPVADPSASVAFAPASCRYDVKSQRLVDFQLPGLDGKAVRLKDLDSDFVLLDFWGTWCGPCRESIPRLVEMQSRYGAKSLKVVGVATEHDATTAQRASRVDAMGRSLGVNYPLLLSEADGKPCPLQEALNVQAYPTLILLDRSGRILWRGTGAEGVTLSTLERVIAARTDPAVLRR